MRSTPELSPADDSVPPSLLAALNALQDHEDEAPRWLAVALEFRAAGHPHQAIEACEACLKLDPQSLEAWVMIAELAQAIGHREIAEDAMGIIRRLAPEDQRLAALAGTR